MGRGLSDEQRAILALALESGATAREVDVSGWVICAIRAAQLVDRRSADPIAYGRRMAAASRSLARLCERRLMERVGAQRAAQGGGWGYVLTEAGERAAQLR